MIWRSLDRGAAAERKRRNKDVGEPFTGFSLSRCSLCVRCCLHDAMLKRDRGETTRAAYATSECWKDSVPCLYSACLFSSGVCVHHSCCCYRKRNMLSIQCVPALCGRVSLSRGPSLLFVISVVTRAVAWFDGGLCPHVGDTDNKKEEDDFCSQCYQVRWN